jgi:hypothetical protein
MPCPHEVWDAVAEVEQQQRPGLAIAIATGLTRSDPAEKAREQRLILYETIHLSLDP